MKSKQILFALCSMLFLALVAAAVVFNYTDIINNAPLAGMSLAAIAPIFVPKSSREAQEWVAKYLDDANQLNTLAKNEKRNLSHVETAEFDTLLNYSNEMRSIARDLKIKEAKLAEQAGQSIEGFTSKNEKWIDSEGRSINVFSKGEKYSDIIPIDERNLSLGRAITAMIKNDWSNAENERRALANTSGSGATLIPSSMYSSIIDKARSLSVLFQAGAKMVEMTTQKMTIARVLQDPTFTVKAQNDAFPDDDMTFDSVELNSFTIGTVIYAAKEVLQDSPNAAAAIEKALIGAFAAKFDQLGLIGAGGTEPRGILNTPGVNTTDFDSFTELTYFQLINLWQKVLTQNGEVTGFVLHPQTLAAMGFARTEIGTNIVVPELIKQIPILHTSSIPVNLGDDENLTVCFAGDFSNGMMIGLRQGLEIEVSGLSGDTFKKNQIAIRAVFRGDIVLTRPNHFVKGINIPPSTLVTA